MHRRQRGITFIGWVILLVPVAILVYAGIRLTPIYLNATKVARVLEQVRQEYQGQASVSQTSLRSALGRRFNIEYIDYPDYKDLSIRKTGEGWEIAAEYDEVVPLVYNVSLLVDFEQSVVIP
jgi:hypothetical protein